MDGKPATPKLCMTRNLNKHSEFQDGGFLQARRTIPREPKLGFRISKLELSCITSVASAQTIERQRLGGLGRLGLQVY